MTYGLSNMYDKKFCKQTVLVQLIIKDVVTFFGAQCIYVTVLSFVSISTLLMKLLRILLIINNCA